MKISKAYRNNEYIIANAQHILEAGYDNDISLMPTIIKCLFHDGLVRVMQRVGMLENIVFQGGTAVQRIYGGPRLSEDLDFYIKHELSNIDEFDEICNELKKCIQTDFAKMYKIHESDIFVKTPKREVECAKIGDVFTWKIAVLVTLGEARQLVKIDLENRIPYTSEIQNFGTLDGNILFHDQILMNVISKDELLANKFISLFQRKNIQYRDMFDLGYLYSNKSMNYDLLIKKINDRFAENEFVSRVEERESKFIDHAMVKTAMQNELNRYLSKDKINRFITDKFIDYTLGIIKSVTNNIIDDIEDKNRITFNR